MIFAYGYVIFESKEDWEQNIYHDSKRNFLILRRFMGSRIEKKPVRFPAICAKRYVTDYNVYFPISDTEQQKEAIKNMAYTAMVEKRKAETIMNYLAEREEKDANESDL